MERDRGSFVEVPLTSLVDLAVEIWRLNCWLSGSESERSMMAVRHTARWLSEFLNEREIEVVDVTGRPYDSGLAVDIIDTIYDEKAEATTEIIDETIAPIVMWRGTLVRHGQVVTRRRP